ncbi:hypothetical protein ACWET9_31635 [Streptomyces sp. NPDC004059]
MTTLRPDADHKDVQQRLAAALVHRPVSADKVEAYFAPIKDTPAAGRRCAGQVRRWHSQR